MSRITFALFGILAGLVTLEITLRFMGPSANLEISNQWTQEESQMIHMRSPNRTLSYELKPNFKRPHDDFQEEIATNSHGFRDYEYSEKKGADTFRILAIGDSVTFGWNMTLEQTYSKRLETLLRKKHGGKIEVLNMGIGGYDSKQEIELILTKGLKFDPDLILIGYVLNDSERYSDNYLLWHFSSSGSQAIDMIRFLSTRLYYKWFADLTDEAFTRLAKANEKFKLPIVVTVFPFLVHKPDGSYPFEFRHAEIREMAKKHNFYCLDLLSAFKTIGLEKLKFKDDVHPSALGHEIAAKEIFNFLETKIPEIKDCN